MSKSNARRTRLNSNGKYKSVLKCVDLIGLNKSNSNKTKPTTNGKDCSDGGSSRVDNLVPLAKYMKSISINKICSNTIEYMVVKNTLRPGFVATKADIGWDSKITKKGTNDYICLSGSISRSGTIGVPGSLPQVPVPMGIAQSPRNSGNCKSAIGRELQKSKDGKNDDSSKNECKSIENSENEKMDDDDDDDDDTSDSSSEDSKSSSSSDTSDSSETSSDSNDDDDDDCEEDEDDESSGNDAGDEDLDQIFLNPSYFNGYVSGLKPKDEKEAKRRLDNIPSILKRFSSSNSLKKRDAEKPNLKLFLTKKFHVLPEKPKVNERHLKAFGDGNLANSGETIVRNSTFPEYKSGGNDHLVRLFLSPNYPNYDDNDNDNDEEDKSIDLFEDYGNVNNIDHANDANDDIIPTQPLLENERIRNERSRILEQMELDETSSEEALRTNGNLLFDCSPLPIPFPSTRIVTQSQ